MKNYCLWVFIFISWSWCMFYLCKSEPTTAMMFNFHMCLQLVGSMGLIHDMARGEVVMAPSLGQINALNTGI